MLVGRREISFTSVHRFLSLVPNSRGFGAWWRGDDANHCMRESVREKGGEVVGEGG
jgi:hypothetical protein